MNRRLLRAAALLGPALAALAPRHAQAIDRIVLEAREIRAPSMQTAEASIALELGADGSATAKAGAARIALTPAASRALPASLREYRNVSLSCAQLVVKEPRFACRDARLEARGGPLGRTTLRASLELDSARGEISFREARIALAGGQAVASGVVGSRRWSVRGRADSLQLAPLLKIASPWMTLPAGYAADARIALDARAAGSARGIEAQFDVRAAEAGFSNEEGNYVGEKLDARLAATARRNTRGEIAFDARLEGSAGQALAGPVLLDFGANPLTLDAKGTLAGSTLRIERAAIAQRNLLRASATAQLQVAATPRIERAHIEVDSLQFPAAYTTFLQIGLAETDFGTLQTGGSASAVLDIAAHSIVRAEGHIDDLDIADARGKFAMQDLRGELRWAADGKPPSYLAWKSGAAYGLSGGAARVDFAAHARGIELLRAARLPIFDGAINIRSLAIGGLGEPDLALEFDATIEPISMPLLSKAFGWPELSGQLSGSIPGLAYRNSMLTVDGDLVAQVFGGTIVGSRFRLTDPLGPWPRLFADVTARNLDLTLVTSTFSVGSITGRLDADIKGLELFDWSPVAFDAKLYSTPGDRSDKRISQKAITRISSVGGGAGGVAAALQSGVLRFFDEFKYDQIGLTCRLRNEVCLMGGIAPAATGYYLVKGRGLPRIDIIGNAGRVDWPQLMSQIVAGMRSEGPVVR